MDEGGRLLCPLCGENWAHVDEVFVAGRPREDGDVEPVHVDHGGRVSRDQAVALPIPDVGRRHAFALKGWCETCQGAFTIEFKQHKGQTLLAVRRPRWEAVTPPDRAV